MQLYTCIKRYPPSINVYREVLAICGFKYTRMRENSGPNKRDRSRNEAERGPNGGNASGVCVCVRVWVCRRMGAGWGKGREHLTKKSHKRTISASSILSCRDRLISASYPLWASLGSAHLHASQTARMRNERTADDSKTRREIPGKTFHVLGIKSIPDSTAGA